MIHAGIIIAIRKKRKPMQAHETVCLSCPIYVLICVKYLKNICTKYIWPRLITNYHNTKSVSGGSAVACQYIARAAQVRILPLHVTFE